VLQAQQLFLVLALGDVLPDAAISREYARGVENRLAAGVDPQLPAFSQPAQLQFWNGWCASRTAICRAQSAEVMLM